MFFSFFCGGWRGDLDGSQTPHCHMPLPEQVYRNVSMERAQQIMSITRLGAKPSLLLSLGPPAKNKWATQFAVGGRVNDPFTIRTATTDNGFRNSCMGAPPIVRAFYFAYLCEPLTPLAGPCRRYNYQPSGQKQFQ